MRLSSAQTNPIDSFALLQLVGVGIGGVLIEQAARTGGLPGPFQQIFHDLAPKRYPAPSGYGGTGRPRLPVPPGTRPGEQPIAPGGCQWADPLRGNTYLEFGVSPANPPRYEGASVVYSGRLLFWHPLQHWEGKGGDTVEIWDPTSCQPFASAVTDYEGFFRHERPLGSDELDGYQVFAVYKGGGFLLDRYDPANSGIWAVVPGA